MKPVKTLILAFTLMLVLATAAFAGETSCPPVEPPPCVPGETNTPPCTAPATSEESAALGEPNTPPVVTDFALRDFTETVGWALSLF